VYLLILKAVLREEKNKTKLESGSGREGGRKITRQCRKLTKNSSFLVAFLYRTRSGYLNTPGFLTYSYIVTFLIILYKTHFLNFGN
jgi:hypothetical protein